MMPIGHLQIGKKVITDTHPYSVLSVAQIIQKSSNIGTSRIALQMEPEDMWGMSRSVGFGPAPESGFPGAVAGLVKPYDKWGKLDQASMSYGYSISTSLFQLARAYTIFVRDGELVPTFDEKSVHSASWNTSYFTESYLQVRTMMETVTQEGGTATKAKVEGYRVGGKTGTAHKSNGKKGYSSNRYDGFFVGIAPIRSPRIVVAVVIDEPTVGGHYGGDVAAPVFSAVTSSTLRALNIPPDANSTQLVQNNMLQQVNFQR
jgi:cell division protein FtsI (penicillin-binding protein 3)